MLQCGDQCYTKDETLSNRAYLALHLLAMELVDNDAMWQYFPFFPKFSFNKIWKAIFFLVLGCIWPIKQRLVGTYLG